MSATSRPPVVWVATSDLSLSGVPVVLERLLEGCDPERRARFHVLAHRGGPLAGRLARLAGSVTVFEPEVGRSVPGAGVAALRSRGSVRLADRSELTHRRRRIRHLERPDVVLVHGAGGWNVAAAAPEDVPRVLHLHELDTALDRCIPAANRRAAFSSVRATMVVADPVADLAVRWGADPDRIVTVPGLVAARPVEGRPATVGSGSGVADERSAATVMGVGQPGWRKGTDRLAAIAHELARTVPGASVGWVGGRPTGADAEWVEADDPVRWFPATEDPWSIVADASVVVVPSREDPLPLVALEAGDRGIPVVATPTGGLPDLLAEDRGYVTTGHDLRELCALVRDAIEDRDESTRRARALQAHVRQHHSAEAVVPRWLSVLDGAAAR